MSVRLGRNVVAGVSTAAILIGSALLSVPLIVDAFGTAGFGVWTIAQSLILFVVLADGGLGTGVLRFVAVAHGAGDRRQIARVGWTALAIYIGVGVAAVALSFALAGTLTSLFDIPAGLEDDARETFRLTGLVVVVALFAAGLGNLQQGLERFVAFAASAAISSVAFIVALVVLIPDAGLPGVAWAAIVQQGTLALARAWSVRDVLAAAAPALLGRRDAKRLVSFSAQMQMSALSTYANNQSDRFVVGLVAPVSTVGQLGIGAQVAEAGRLIAGTAINPFVSRMSVVHGGGDAKALEALYTRFERLWTLMVLGATAVALATLYPLIESWLGEGHGEAALLGGILVFAFGVNLLTGMGTAYLRAIGRPGLEARYGLMVIALNLPITVALGLAAGSRGVVAGTACAYVAGTLWFFAKLRRVAPARPRGSLGSPARLAAVTLLSAGAPLAWGLAMVELLPPGVALVPVALGIGAGLLAFMSLTTGVRPTVANARALLG